MVTLPTTDRSSTILYGTRTNPSSRALCIYGRPNSSLCIQSPKFIVIDDGYLVNVLLQCASDSKTLLTFVDEDGLHAYLSRYHIRSRTAVLITSWICRFFFSFLTDLIRDFIFPKQIVYRYRSYSQASLLPNLAQLLGTNSLFKKRRWNKY